MCAKRKLGERQRIYIVQIGGVEIVKRTLASLLIAVLFLTAFPINSSASFDWTGWEISENRDDPTYPYVGYYAPFQDATFDEIVYCIANILAEYIPATDIQNEWQPRQMVFSYSSDDSFSTVMNTTEIRSLDITMTA